MTFIYPWLLSFYLSKLVVWSRKERVSLWSSAIDKERPTDDKGGFHVVWISDHWRTTLAVGCKLAFTGNVSLISHCTSDGLSRWEKHRDIKWDVMIEWKWNAKYACFEFWRTPDRNWMQIWCSAHSTVSVRMRYSCLLHKRVWSYWIIDKETEHYQRYD